MLEGESLTFLRHAPHLTPSLSVCWLSSPPPHQLLHNGNQEVDRLPRTEGWSWAPQRPYQQEDDPERPHGHPAHPQAFSDLSGLEARGTQRGSKLKDWNSHLRCKILPSLRHFIRWDLYSISLIFRYYLHFLLHTINLYTYILKEKKEKERLP